MLRIFRVFPFIIYFFNEIKTYKMSCQATLSQKFIWIPSVRPTAFLILFQFQYKLLLQKCDILVRSKKRHFQIYVPKEKMGVVINVCLYSWCSDPVWLALNGFISVHLANCAQGSCSGLFWYGFFIMTSWHRIASSITDSLWGLSNGDRWITLTNGQ